MHTGGSLFGGTSTDQVRDGQGPDVLSCATVRGDDDKDDDPESPDEPSTCAKAVVSRVARLRRVP